MYRSIVNLYQSYYPFSEQKCKNMAIWLIGCIMLLWLPGVFIFSLYKSGYFFYLQSGFFLFFVFTELYFLVKAYEKGKFGKEFVLVLSNVRHQYYRCFHVVDAVYYAAEGLGYEAQKHLECLKNILCSEDKKEEAEKYKSQIHDRYYRMLLLQAASIEEHGDERADGNSIFLWSLGHLRKEAEIECRNSKRMEYLLSGLGMVIGIPVLLLPVIRSWAVGNLPELSSFYDGAAGRCMELVAFGLTIGMYISLRELKGQTYRPFFIGLVLWMARIEKIKKFAAWYVSRHSEEEGYKQLLRRTGDRRNQEEFFLYRIFTAFIFQMLFLAIYAGLYEFGEITPFIWIPAMLLMPVMGYWYPVLRLFIAKMILADRMQEEVLDFQFLIRMERKLPGITTLELLEELEENSVIFQKSLQECIRDFGLDEHEAFLRLWQEEEYPPFRRIVDMFLMAEETGIAEAFDEIEDDMEEFQENRKLEVEILQERKAEAAMLLACLPGIFILFGYLIIPFMLECFRMLGNYNGSIAAI